MVRTRHGRGYPSPPKPPILQRRRANVPDNMSDADGDASRIGPPATVRTVTVFAPLTHPVLKSVDPVAVSQFVREREWYERQVAEKKAELPTLTAASYNVSIDSELLQTMVFLGKFDDIAPDVEAADLTSDHVKTFIDGLVKASTSDFDPKVVDNVLKGIRVQMSIADPEARMLHYVNDFFKRLNSVGYGAFKKENPKKTVELLCKNLFPAQLRDAMKERVEYDVTLEKDVKKFVQRMCDEAKACQTYGQSTRTQRSTPKKEHDGASSSSTTPRRTPTLKAHICWWPAHAAKGIRHKLVDCTACPEDEKKKIFEERRRKREADVAKNVRRVGKDTPPDETESSIIFTCTFAQRTRDVVTADIGSEVNLMDETLLKRIVRDGGDVEVKDLHQPRTFSMVVTTAGDKDVNVVCKKMATMPIELHIRHGKTLVLRNVQWMVTDQGCTESLLSRPVLERIGLVARDVIERAADRLGGEVDVADLGGGRGRISRIMEGVFHSNGGVDERDVDAEDWLDFGELKSCTSTVVNGAVGTLDSRHRKSFQLAKLGISSGKYKILARICAS